MLSIFTNLHGSQTARGTGGRLLGFRDLQTYMVLKHKCFRFRQNQSFRSLQTYMVLKPARGSLRVLLVLDPYKLTWFSNTTAEEILQAVVLDPYKLTWFSNLKPQI